MSESFIIPLNGLATGKNEFSWMVGKEFFESFENSEIIDAELDVTAVVEKSGRYVGVDCDVVGKVVVECDRCLEELEMPVDVEIMLSVKYGEEESSEDPHEGEREVIFVPETDAELDMSQIVYDYVCLALPMQRVHPDGECNPDAMRHLSGETEDGMAENSPFAALKDLMK
ncbi:MAG: DUF177 domain-containing protein [Bacteroidales bacterium]|nr:DUF177 domain-containing protein [Bacteroidales bacterium]